MIKREKVLSRNKTDADELAKGCEEGDEEGSILGVHFILVTPNKLLLHLKGQPVVETKQMLPLTRGETLVGTCLELT